jgi:putative transposase
MRASRFSEEQIIGILREHEAGAKTPELCRRHGISDATFYIYGRLPRGKKVSGPVLTSSIANIYPASPLMARPNGKSAHTLLDKWSA